MYLKSGPQVRLDAAANTVVKTWHSIGNMRDKNRKASLHGKEQRRYPRYFVSWRAEIIFDSIDGRTMFEAVTHEVSIHGASIYTEHNLAAEQRVALVLAIPPLAPDEQVKIVKIRGSTIYTVLEANKNVFRTGIQFLKFKDDGHALLEKSLAQRFPKRI